MFLDFSKYFFKHIFRSKRHRGPLLIALAGIFLSSFALIIIQSTMGGLQNSLMARNKAVDGHAVIFLNDDSSELLEKVKIELSKRDLVSFEELELELLVKKGNYISPAVIHGISKNHPVYKNFLQDYDQEELILGGDLSRKIKAMIGDYVELISPAHVHSLMGEIPREVSVPVSDLLRSDLPEKDLFHGWVRVSLLQNLIRKRSVNRLRIFSPYDYRELRQDFLAKFQNKVNLKSWEQMNSSLVGAFRLETSVMVFLFVSMTFLVAIAIVSGFLIFFGKIKIDLISMWILGQSKRAINTNMKRFLHFLGLIMSFAGMLFGVICLLVFDNQAINLMPDIFVDQRIPVLITFKGVLISIIIPYFVSAFFGIFSLKKFNQEESSYISRIRSIS